MPTTLDSRSASIKSRQFDNTIALKEYIPGPGLYEIPSSIDNGKNSVFESQYRSGGSPKMVTKEEGEPYVRKTRIPGPGECTYDAIKMN